MVTVAGNKVFSRHLVLYFILYFSGSEKLHKPKTIASLQNPIQSLQKKLEARAKKHTESHEEADKSTFINDFSGLSLGSACDDSNKEETQNLRKEKDFRKQSLEFILQPDVCVRRLRQVKTEQYLHTTGMNQSQDVSMSHDLSSPQKRKSQLSLSERKHKKLSEHVEKLVDKVHVLQEKLDNARRRWDLKEHFDINVGSLSYYRLVLSCSCIVGCDPKQVHSMILSQINYN